MNTAKKEAPLYITLDMVKRAITLRATCKMAPAKLTEAELVDVEDTMETNRDYCKKLEELTIAKMQIKESFQIIPSAVEFGKDDLKGLNDINIFKELRFLETEDKVVTAFMRLISFDKLDAPEIKQTRNLKIDLEMAMYPIKEALNELKNDTKATAEKLKNKTTTSAKNGIDYTLDRFREMKAKYHFNKHQRSFWKATILKCSKCGKKVKDDASTCPKCKTIITKSKDCDNVINMQEVKTKKEEQKAPPTNKETKSTTLNSELKTAKKTTPKQSKPESVKKEEPKAPPTKKETKSTTLNSALKTAKKKSATTKSKPESVKKEEPKAPPTKKETKSTTLNSARKTAKEKASTAKKDKSKK